MINYIWGLNEMNNRFLGIELGSTRIKAVLIDGAHNPIASGSHEWENRLENGVFTYRLDDVWNGLQDCFKKLSKDVQDKCGAPLTEIDGIGISAMMHGYLAFDGADNLLVPFRTWRNTITEQAAEQLTELFGFNIPQRWSIAQLYQAILNNEEHVKDVAFITTLAGYVHWKLTGEKVLGVGDASGMFPIDSVTKDFNTTMKEKFGKLVADKGFGCDIEHIMPHVLSAGQDAGKLTEEGARLLDPTGQLKAGIPMCAPEGDAGTGMVATNSVAPRTGNISAGTSVFAMIVLEKELSRYYTEVDMVTTPSGAPVAMVHCNTCTTDLDAWIKIMQELTEALGQKVGMDTLYDVLYAKALEGDADCGGLISYNYYSGEPVSQVETGRPLFVRTPSSSFTLANFMRTQVYSTMATLKMGMDMLFENEHVLLDRLLGHGGLFKSKGVGQQIMAGALNVPVAVMETAGEGGAWGISLLAAYMVSKSDDETLEAYLDKKVFAGSEGIKAEPKPEDIEGFAAFMKRYEDGLEIERAAGKHMN